MSFEPSAVPTDGAAAPAFHPDNIPDPLKALHQWCVWRRTLIDGKLKKIPYQPNGKPAKSNDAATWSSWEAALAAYQTGKYDGLGLFMAGNLTGIDLDHCIDASGATPAATEILERFGGTYIEVSPSGTGYRIFCYGKPGRSGKNGGAVKWVEVYAEGSPRYLTVTGNVINPVMVTAQQSALDWLHTTYFSKPATRKQNTTTRVNPSLDDAALLDKASKASNGAIFDALWRGDTSGHGGDASSADMALCGLLAFWTGGDASAVDRLFRQSGLMRDKWDTRRGETTYGAATVATAVANCKEVYSGRKPVGKGEHGRCADTASGREPGDGGSDDWEVPADFCAADDDETAAASEKAADDAAEIARLAALNLLDYDRQRGAVAKTLGIRADTLDKLVKEARGDADDSSGGKAMCFREVMPWPEPVAGDELLNELTASVRLFMSLPDHAAPAIALWVVYTYCVVSYGHIAPTLAITSPEKRCGKSTLLGWLYRVVEKPMLAANITPAAIFRVIDAWSPTLLMDEADSFLGETGDELRGILNSGHTRDTAWVARVVGDEHEPRQFSTWGAKAIALIGKLEGRYSTLADRSVEIQLRRRLPTDKVEKLRHADAEHFERLAARCFRFSLDHGAAIGKARPDIPDALHDRAADNWEPLLAIADRAGGRWPRLARTVAMALSGGADDDGIHGIGVQLLADLRRYFEKNPEVASHSTIDILNYLVGIDDAPWSSYAKGKHMTPRQLSRVLKPYGIIPQNIRVGNTVPKGYTVADFKDAFARYLPSIRYNATNKATSSESTDSVSATQTGCSGYESGSSASQQAGCSGVADKTAETGGGGADVADSESGTWEEF
jgi:primase-polymerase (primpol)-like protein